MSTLIAGIVNAMRFDFMLSQNNPDFVFGSNGHARLSQGKVAELLKVSQQAVSKLVNSNNLDLGASAESLATYGFDGHNLSVLVEYYAFDSKQASRETVAQCRKIYRQAGAKSFQDFIDAMAGIEAPKPQPILTTLDKADKALSIAERFVGLFKTMNPAAEQCLKDLVLNTLNEYQPQLPGTVENWMGVVNFAELELGYRVPMKGEYRRSALGLWVTFYYPHLAERKDHRLCNETQQEIWVYPIHQPEVREQLTEAVKMFFIDQAPGTKLRLDGAFKKKA